MYVDNSLNQSNPSLLSMGLLKHFDDQSFDIANKSNIPCEVKSIATRGVC